MEDILARVKKGRGRVLLFFWLGILLVCSFEARIEAMPVEKAISLPVKEKTDLEKAKPGHVIFIGVVSPDLPEALWGERLKDRRFEPVKELGVNQEEERPKLQRRLQELEKERQVLVGDFYGLNQYGYRYAMVFDRLGFIRYRLHEVDEEIKVIKKKLKIS